MVDLSKYTKKEIFSKVKTHLLTQNKTSENESGRCLYRGPDKLKCAAGCLITDEQYDITMEGYKWEGLVNEKFVSSHHQELIKNLQYIHDNFFPEDWEIKLNILEREL